MAINGQRFLTHLEELAQFTASPGNGVSRYSYTTEDRQAREWLKNICDTAGLTMQCDDIGNIFVRLEGKNGDLLPLATGSHLDTVKNGGKYDGALGVVAGLEVLLSLKNEKKYDRGLELIIFAEEEGSNFGPTCIGSRFLTGHLQYQDLQSLQREDGKSAHAVLTDFGLKPVPESFSTTPVLTKKYHAFVELHVEQSSKLEDANCVIGTVQAIAGRHLLKIHLQGEANHAGAKPMIGRRDALVTAARIISEADHICRKQADSATTVTIGSIEVTPNVANVIAGKTSFTVDIRAVENDEMTRVQRLIEIAALQISSEASLSIDIEVVSLSPGVKMDKSLLQCISNAAETLGISSMELVSGAVHDAAYMTELAPTGLIFVPSIAGISHNPKEDTRDEDLLAGVSVLYSTVRDLLAIE